MAKECRRPNCGHELNGETSGHASHTSHLDHDFCSRYCREYVEQDLQPINGAEKFGKNQFVGFNWEPKIPIKCDNCGCETHLVAAFHGNGNNRWFCSRECHNQIKKAGKRSNRDYNMLRVLRELGWRTTPKKRGRWMYAHEIAKTMELFNFKCNSSSAAQVMRLYAKRGIVEIKYDDGGAYPLQSYRLKPSIRSIPLAKIVRDYY